MTDYDKLLMELSEELNKASMSLKGGDLLDAGHALFKASSKIQYELEEENH